MMNRMQLHVNTQFQVIWTLFDVILRSKPQKIAKNASFWVTTLCSFFFEGRQECKTRADICVLVHHQPEDQFLGHGLVIFAIHWHCYNLKVDFFRFWNFIFWTLRSNLGILTCSDCHKILRGTSSGSWEASVQILWQSD